MRKSIVQPTDKKSNCVFRYYFDLIEPKHSFNSMTQIRKGPCGVCLGAETTDTDRNNHDKMFCDWK